MGPMLGPEVPYSLNHNTVKLWVNLGFSRLELGKFPLGQLTAEAWPSLRGSPGSIGRVMGS